ncbi:hypothetical protein L798_09830 [Zootermopsis nevadensis]|uniref:Uncharacterized protein n=1 Tax=Zootermopsis nevadensis TaxID=136037 RepID=A0A067RB64_ZOONE|nr:hypothetical protein L798_09830 [Zootermopsis nevadensis]
MSTPNLKHNFYNLAWVGIRRWVPILQRKILHPSSGLSMVVLWIVVPYKLVGKYQQFGRT